MKWKRNILSWIRIILAALSFIAAWGAVWYYPQIAETFLIQFGSSWIEILVQISWGAAIAVVSITLITLLVGRIYCSVLCPLGIMQDVISIFPRKQHYNSWTKFVKYPLFAFCVIFALLGFIAPLTVLMPSANFVQIVNYGFRETAYLAGLGAESSNPALFTMIFSWGLFAVLFVLSRWSSRIYCNTLCPVGALLSIFAKFSLFKIRINQEKCISCGACERICKAGCIDAKNRKVNNEDCIMCMNCLSHCKFNALELSAKKTEKCEIPGRREFLAAGVVAAGSAAVGLLIRKKAEPTKAVMPPGAGDFDHFTKVCVGCGLCISACNGNVLTPSITEYGLRGFMQPHLDFNKGECKFKCKRCTEVCPCGALLPLALKEKQQWRIGIAKYNPKLCVAYDAGEDCGACAEHCPVGALTMEPYKETSIPKVNEKLCIGCGACQHICPIYPEKAIVITGIPNQHIVEKPNVEESIKLEAEDDFPF